MRTSSRSTRKTARSSGTSRSPTAKKGFWSTNAPLVIRNHLIVGVSGDFDNLPGTLKSFDPETGQDAVDVLQHAAARHAWFDQRRRHRRSDVDDRHLRSRAEPAVRRHRQSDAGAERSVSSRRQPLDLQHRRAQPGHRQARVGLPGVAARHARLGRGRSAGARRRRLRRRAAQAAAAGVAQRLLLRARSHERQEPADDAVRGGELGERVSTRKAGRFRIRRRSRRAMAASSRRTRAAAPTIDRRASIRRPAF